MFAYTRHRGALKSTKILIAKDHMADLNKSVRQCESFETLTSMEGLPVYISHLVFRESWKLMIKGMSAFTWDTSIITVRFSELGRTLQL